MVPLDVTSTSGTMMSSFQYLFEAETSGHNESRKGRHCDILRPPDSGFEHSAAPDRNSPLAAKGLELPGFCMSSHPAEFDIDDPASSDAQRFARVINAQDRFVQTDRRGQFLLQRCVVDDAVIGQRLLDQHQIEIIQRLKVSTSFNV